MVAGTPPSDAPVAADVRTLDTDATALEQPVVDPSVLHPVALYAHLGIATPYGGAGLSLDVVPTSWLGLEGGVGTNFDSPEFAFMPRIRFGATKDKVARFTLGAGFSYLHRYYAHQYNGLAGYFRVFEAMGEGRQELTLFESAYFANVEIGSEIRRGHLAARVYLGFTHLVSSSQHACTEGDFPCSSNWGTNLLYLGGAVGYAF